MAYIRLWVLAGLLIPCVAALCSAQGGFVRGDVDQDGRLGIGDAICSLRSWNYRDCPMTTCLDAADANDDGKLNIVDAIATLLYLFDWGPALPPPNEACGRDPTPDSLECWYSPLCGTEDYQSRVLREGSDGTDVSMAFSLFRPATRSVLKSIGAYLPR